MGVFTSKPFIVYAHTSHEFPKVKRLPTQNHVSSPGSVHEPEHLLSVSDLPAGAWQYTHGNHKTSAFWLNVHLDAEAYTRQHGLQLFLPRICKFKLKLLMSDCLWARLRNSAGQSTFTLDTRRGITDGRWASFLVSIKACQDRCPHFYLLFVSWSVIYNFINIFIGLFNLLINRGDVCVGCSSQYTANNINEIIHFCTEDGIKLMSRSWRMMRLTWFWCRCYYKSSDNDAPTHHLEKTVQKDAAL